MLQQSLRLPIESDEPEEGQTVIFCLQGVFQPIYGRIIKKGETESTKTLELLHEILKIADFGNGNDGEMSAIMQKAAEAIKLQDPSADMSAYIWEAK